MSWIRFAERVHAPLSARILQEAQCQPVFGRCTGISAGLNNHLWLSNVIFLRSDEIRLLMDTVGECYAHEGRAFFVGFAERCRQALDGITGAPEFLLSGLDSAASASSERISQILISWFEFYRAACAFVPVFRVIDQFLVHELGIQQLGHSPELREQTEEQRERAAISGLAKLLFEKGDLGAESDEAARLLDIHAAEFGWLGTRWYLGEPLSIAHFRRRVVAMMGRRPLLSKPGVRPGRAKDHGQDELKEIVAQLAYLRTRRAEAMNKAIWAMRPTLREVSRRIGLNEDDIVWLLPDELLSALGGQSISTDIVNKRRNHFGTALVGGEFEVISGEDELREFVQRVFGNADPGVFDDGLVEGEVALSGTPAWGGRVQGVVRIVKSAADASRVEEGNVMVAVMTYPHYVAAMQRAAAIVTDDGGLLSHAAIVAREMGKPCLIETGNATRQFADGDLVEVDCFRGVVRRIEENPK